MRKNWVLLSLAGGATALAFAPMFWVWVLPLTISYLFWALQHAGSPKDAAKRVWVFAYAFALCNIYWVYIPGMLLGSVLFAILLPVLLALLLSLPAPIIGFLTYRLFKTPVARVIFFVLCWVILSEFIFQRLLQFSWHTVGYAIAFSDISLQLVSLGGVYGASILLLLWSATPFIWRTEPTNLRKTLYAGFTLISMLLVGAFGWWRLEKALRDPHTGTPIHIVQPSITVKEKWNPQRRQKIFWEMIEMSKKSQLKPGTCVIWPEASVPFFIGESAWQCRLLSQYVIPEKGYLIMGSLHRTTHNCRPGEPFLPFTSIFLFNDQGEILKRHDKTILAPFGEFFPFKEWVKMVWPWALEKITPGAIDYEPGAHIAHMEAPGLPSLGPLLCYEVDFTCEAHPVTGPISWFAHLTNDNWFGDSTAPYQHLAITRVRAVEEGRPIVRCANTGISAIIDAWGRVLKSLPLDKRGTIDGTVPVHTCQTFYRHFIPGLIFK